MGGKYSQHVLEKALFMTQANKANPIPAALDWINQHENDPDFAEQLFIVNPNPQQVRQLQGKPKYTPEQAKALAKEL